MLKTSSQRKESHQDDKIKDHLYVQLTFLVQWNAHEGECQLETSY